MCRHRPQYRYVKCYFLSWNVFVLLYTFRSKDQISIGNGRCKYGSCQRLNRVVELECFCFAEIDCVVSKTMKLLRGRRTGRTLHLNNTAARVWRRLFQSLGSLVKQHGTSMTKIFQLDFKIFQRRVLFPLTGWYTRETSCQHDGSLSITHRK